MWQSDGFGSGWNDWCVQGGFTQDPSVPAAPLMEGFVLAKQEGVIRGQYMEAVASSGSVCSSRALAASQWDVPSSVWQLLKHLDATAAGVVLP